MKKFWVFWIELYQRHISPRKGFKCAHAYVHGGKSCSNAVKDIVLEYGLIRGFSRIRGRFQECSDASLTLGKKKRRKRDRWYDYCDCGFLGDYGSCIRCRGKPDLDGTDCCDGPFDCSP